MKNDMERDVWLYRMIIAAFGLTLVATVVGAIVLVMTQQQTPDALVALGFRGRWRSGWFPGPHTIEKISHRDGIMIIQALAIHARACCSIFLLKTTGCRRERRLHMFRKFLILILMVPLLVAASAAGASFPLLFLMASLLLIALAAPSKSEETQE